jgi:hypothetical protein
MPIPANLVPTEDEDAKFRDLLKEHFNVTLTENEARRIHIRLLRLYWLMNDEVHRLRSQEQ